MMPTTFIAKGVAVSEQRGVLGKRDTIFLITLVFYCFYDDTQHLRDRHD